jgi:hypothetical protein
MNNPDWKTVGDLALGHTGQVNRRGLPDLLLILSSVRRCELPGTSRTGPRSPITPNERKRPERQPRPDHPDRQPVYGYLSFFFRVGKTVAPQNSVV